MGPQLVVTCPDGSRKSVSLKDHPVTIGRATSNEISYPEDAGLSRHHLVIEPEHGAWQVRDLGSRNGTFVNGNRIADPQALEPGDRIVASRLLIAYGAETGARDKTVLFEPSRLASEHAVMTTLDAVLLGSSAGEEGAQGRPAAAWDSAVTALVRAGRELAARRPLPELFSVILDLGMEAVGAERGVLLTRTKDQLSVQASRGEGFRISSAVRDRVLDEKASLLIRDVQSDESLRERFSIVGQNVRTLMAVPLQTDQQVLGLLYVDTPVSTRQFTADDLNLLTVMANVAAMRIERERLIEIEETEKLMLCELERAAEIQRRFLPAQPPEIPGLDLAGFNIPCHSVGGDYYDFLSYPDGRLAMLIADVAGKGMSAALLMANLQAKVQALGDACMEPAEFVTRLNRSMATSCPDNRFVTFFFCVLNPLTGELVYCNAGHNSPLLVRNQGGVARLKGGGPVLGIIPCLEFEQERECMMPGDALLLYSDGATETFNHAEEEFGEDRLGGVLEQQRRQPAESAIQELTAAIKAWSAGAPLPDDVTLVVARRTA